MTKGDDDRPIVGHPFGLPRPATVTALHTGRLVLTPASPDVDIETAALIRALTDGGLLGAPLPALTGHVGAAFVPGAAFSYLIAFTGCAVQYPTVGADTTPTLHLRITGPFAEARLCAGRNSRPPRCPACGKPLSAWREQVAAARCDAPLALTCTTCSATAPGTDWRWGLHAGLGRVFVSCEEVFPGEGQPTERLLRLLDALGIGPWRHFYVQD